MKEYVLLQHLSTKKRKTWEELATLTGFSHRTVQRCIEDLRNKGIRVSSLDSTKGYKLCSTEEEYQALLVVYKSRIRTLLNTLIALSSEKESIDWIMDDVINKTCYTG